MATAVAPRTPTPSYAVARRAEQRARQLQPLIQVARCRVPGAESVPTWAVQSATRPHHFHLVYLAELASRQRLMCTCEARRLGGAVTCYHAQAVRLQIRAGRMITPELSAALGQARLHKGGEQPPASPYTPRGLDVFTPDLPDLAQLPAEQRAEYAAWADHLSGSSPEAEPPTCSDCGQTFTELPAGEVVSGLICGPCADRRRESARAFTRGQHAERQTRRRTTGGELPTRAPEDRPNTRRTTISRPRHADAPPAHDDRPFSIYK